jgi:hypothetical protein
MLGEDCPGLVSHIKFATNSRAPAEFYWRRLPGAEVEGLGRFLAFVEELVDGGFESFGQFFERFDGRDGMGWPFSTRER